MKFRPIEKVRTIIQDATGLDIMYAYDDLVFAEYGTYLFQFDDKKDDNLICFLNEEFDKQKYPEQLEKLEDTSKQHGYSLLFKGKFSMTQENEEIKIKFIN
ncbi:hypothetical protein R9C00_08905 [Flammeovirgaceae bacterium SG7u.111]|nr:hypothetical protein [Flammeovirgaceae bacterium SG7u.132]WPO37567.1 hypothetical protein R9C00_08905 [Flammeovirgaceae bacterium SG7u.111]